MRPFRVEEFDVVWEARRGLDSAAQPSGSPEHRRLRQRLERSGRLTDGQLDLAIEVGGRLIGEIQTYDPPGRPLPPGVFEVGIAIYHADMRGKGYGSEAVSLLTEWLFDGARAHRVQAATELGNAPMRRVLEKVGFERDETVREFDREDVLYAMTKPERWTPGR